MKDLNIRPITYETARRNSLLHAFDILPKHKDTFQYFYADIDGIDMICVQYFGNELRDLFQRDSQKTLRSYYLHPTSNEWFEFSEDEQFEIETYFTSEPLITKVEPQMKNPSVSFEYTIINSEKALKLCPSLVTLVTFNKKRVFYLDAKVNNTKCFCIFYEGLPLFNTTQDTTSSMRRGYVFNKDTCKWDALDFDTVSFLSSSLAGAHEGWTVHNEVAPTIVNQKVTVEEMISTLTLKEWAKLTSDTRVAIIEKFFKK